LSAAAPRALVSSPAAAVAATAPAAQGARLPELTALLRAEWTLRLDADHAYFAALRLGRDESAIELRPGQFVYMWLFGCSMVPALHVVQLLALFCPLRGIKIAPGSGWLEEVVPELVFAEVALFLRPEQVQGGRRGWHAPSELIAANVAICPRAVGCIVRACNVVDYADREQVQSAPDVYFCHGLPHSAPETAVHHARVQRAIAAALPAVSSSSSLPALLDAESPPANAPRPAPGSQARKRLRSARVAAPPAPPEQVRKSERLGMKKRNASAAGMDKEERARNERNKIAKKFVAEEMARSRDSDRDEYDKDDSFIDRSDVSTEGAPRTGKSAVVDDDDSTSSSSLSSNESSLSSSGASSFSSTVPVADRCSTARVPPGAHKLDTESDRRHAFVIYLQFIASCILDPTVEFKEAMSKADQSYFNTPKDCIVGLIKDKRDMITKSGAWLDSVRTDLLLYPLCAHETGFLSSGGTCQVCKRCSSNDNCRLRLHGATYQSKKLWDETLSIYEVANGLRRSGLGTASLQASDGVLYSCGSRCVERTALYHALHHLPLHFIVAVLEFVWPHEQEGLDAAEIVAILVSSTQWVADQYAKFQYVMDSADEFHARNAIDADGDVLELNKPTP
jgi:hypothetical protein